MISGVTMKINMDEYILHALKEDITSEDVSTNAVMPENRQVSFSPWTTRLSTTPEIPDSFMI